LGERDSAVLDGKQAESHFDVRPRSAALSWRVFSVDNALDALARSYRAT